MTDHAELIERLGADMGCNKYWTDWHAKAADALTTLHRENADLRAEVERLREALRPFAESADGRRAKGIRGYVCFSQTHLVKARAALGHTQGGR